MARSRQHPGVRVGLSPRAGIAPAARRARLRPAAGTRPRPARRRAGAVRRRRRASAGRRCRCRQSCGDWRSRSCTRCRSTEDGGGRRGHCAAAQRRCRRGRVRASPKRLPVRFDRRRVYVLPTRFGLFFALLLLAMWLGALNYNNNPALMLCLLLAGAANTSLLAAHLQLSGLQRRGVRRRPGAGRRDARRAIAPFAPIPDAHVADCAWTAMASRPTLSLADGNGQAVFSLPTQRRGWLDLRAHPRLDHAAAGTCPCMGLRLARRAVARVSRAGAARTCRCPTAPARRHALARVHPSGDDVHHLRAYRRGDARRTIAWKPSARRDALLVREYEQPLGADVVLDWRQIPGSTMKRASAGSRDGSTTPNVRAPLSPAATGTAAARPGFRPAASPCLPARAGAVASHRRGGLMATRR